jgi:hypothetical protein
MTLPTYPLAEFQVRLPFMKGVEQSEIGKLSQAKLDFLYEDALKDTIARYGGDRITRHFRQRTNQIEFRYFSWLVNLNNIDADGFSMPFEDSHT